MTSTAPSKPLPAARPSRRRQAQRICRGVDPMNMQPHTRAWKVVALVAVLGAGCGLFDADAGERDRVQDEAESFLEELDLGSAFAQGPIHSIPATTPQERFGPSTGSTRMSYTSKEPLTTREFRDLVFPVLRSAGLEIVRTGRYGNEPKCSEDRISIEFYSSEVQLPGRVNYLPEQQGGVASFTLWYKPLPLGGGEDVEYVTESDISCPGDSP